VGNEHSSKINSEAPSDLIFEDVVSVPSDFCEPVIKAKSKKSEDERKTQEEERTEEEEETDEPCGEDGGPVPMVMKIRSDVSTFSIVRGESGREGRHDQYGNIIRVGSNAHKASFKDERAGPIADVAEITAYKNFFGVLEPMPADPDPPAKKGCGCVLM